VAQSPIFSRSLELRFKRYIRASSDVCVRRAVQILLYSNTETNGTFCRRRAFSSAALLWEDHAMALRGKSITKAPDPDEPAEKQFSQRQKPEVGQFRLQVDRQTKASFTTFEAAEEAGLEIKKGYCPGWLDGSRKA
jgi:hypothetical protein